MQIRTLRTSYGNVQDIWVATLYRRMDRANRDLIISAHGRHVNIWRRRGMKQNLTFHTDRRMRLRYYAANHSVQANHNLFRFWQAIVERDDRMPVRETNLTDASTANYKLWSYETDTEDKIRSVVQHPAQGADVITIGDLENDGLYKGGTSLAQVLDLIR